MSYKKEKLFWIFGLFLLVIIMSKPIPVKAEARRYSTEWNYYVATKGTNVYTQPSLSAPILWTYSISPVLMACDHPTQNEGIMWVEVGVGYIPMSVLSNYQTYDENLIKDKIIYNVNFDCKGGTQVLDFRDMDQLLLLDDEITHYAQQGWISSSIQTTGESQYLNTFTFFIHKCKLCGGFHQVNLMFYDTDADFVYSYQDKLVRGIYVKKPGGIITAGSKDISADELLLDSLNIEATR